MRMTFETLENAFLQKYPNGTIYRNENKVCVAFNKGSKVYDYNYLNYTTIYEKLELNTTNVDNDLYRLMTFRDEITGEYYTRRVILEAN